MSTYDTLKVDIGNTPNDDQGDPLRTAFDKINQRFAELRIFVSNRGNWQPNTAYTANPNRDWVIVAGVGYLATGNHISGATFAADLAAGKWLAADALLAIAQTDALRADLASAAGAASVGFRQFGAGAAHRSLQAKAREVVSIEDFGANGTLAGDTAAIKAAIAYASAAWLPIMLPARRIFWDGTPITENRVRLWGAGMPALNSGRTALTGGTIIQGPLQCSGEYIDLQNFGVDIGIDSGVAPNDAIKCLSSVYNGGKTLHTENIIGLCRSPSVAFHAVLFEGYAQHTGGNVQGVNGYFGVVLKNRNILLSSIKAAESSDTGVYFKSDNVYGQCSDIQVGSIEVSGATPGAVAFAVRLQSDSALMDNVQIDKIQAAGHGSALLVQTLNNTGAAFGVARINTIISNAATADDVFVYNFKPAGRLDCLDIGSIISSGTSQKVVNLLCESAAEIGNVNVGSVYASYPASTSGETLNNSMLIGGGVKNTNFGSVALLIEHGRTAGAGAINFQNVGGQNVLGPRRARLLGPNRPAGGFSTQTLSGAAAALAVPANDSGRAYSFVKLTHTAPITIASFVQPAGNSAFVAGHVLTIFNATSHLVTLHTNGAGAILNPGYGTVTIGENELRSWVVGDDNVWRGLP